MDPRELFAAALAIFSAYIFYHLLSYLYENNITLIVVILLVILLFLLNACFPSSGLADDETPPFTPIPNRRRGGLSLIGAFPQTPNTSSRSPPSSQTTSSDPLTPCPPSRNGTPAPPRPEPASRIPTSSNVVKITPSSASASRSIPRLPSAYSRPCDSVLLTLKASDVRIVYGRLYQDDSDDRIELLYSVEQLDKVLRKKGELRVWYGHWSWVPVDDDLLVRIHQGSYRVHPAYKNLCWQDIIDGTEVDDGLDDAYYMDIGPSFQSDANDASYERVANFVFDHDWPESEESDTDSNLSDSFYDNIGWRSQPDPPQELSITPKATVEPLKAIEPVSTPVKQVNLPTPPESSTPSPRPSSLAKEDDAPQADFPAPEPLRDSPPQHAAAKTGDAPPSPPQTSGKELTAPVTSASAPISLPQPVSQPTSTTTYSAFDAMMAEAQRQTQLKAELNQRLQGLAMQSHTFLRLAEQFVKSCSEVGSGYEGPMLALADYMSRAYETIIVCKPEGLSPQEAKQSGWQPGLAWVWSTLVPHGHVVAANADLTVFAAALQKFCWYMDLNIPLLDVSAPEPVPQREPNAGPPAENAPAVAPFSNVDTSDKIQEIPKSAPPPPPMVFGASWSQTTSLASAPQTAPRKATAKPAPRRPRLSPLSVKPATAQNPVEPTAEAPDSVDEENELTIGQQADLNKDLQAALEMDSDEWDEFQDQGEISSAQTKAPALDSLKGNFANSLPGFRKEFAALKDNVEVYGELTEANLLAFIQNRLEKASLTLEDFCEKTKMESIPTAGFEEYVAVLQSCFQFLFDNHDVIENVHEGIWLKVGIAMRETGEYFGLSLRLDV